MDWWEQIDGQGRFARVEALEKGWSRDRKFIVDLKDGQRWLLRLSPADQWERKKKEYAAMERLPQDCAALLPRPKGFGRCDAGIYTLLSFVPGQDAEPALRGLTPAQQYGLGLRAGLALRQLHALPAFADAKPWEARFNAKMDAKIRAYRDCPIRFRGGERLVEYIQDHRTLLRGRPQGFQHGDYHCGNMTLTQDLRLGVVDFNRMDSGDPWEEFNRIVWCAAASPAFAAGRVDGYFDGPVPEAFFPLLLLYIASNQLSSIVWAIPFGEGEVQTMLRQAEQLNAAYEGFTRTVPLWYEQGRRLAGCEGGTGN